MAYDLVKSALLRHKEKCGSMLVPPKFYIPIDDDSWPKKSWGMKLGETVDNIRRGHSYAERRAELLSIASASCGLELYPVV